ncbi:hypothetical protein AC579_4527 [Pseudocercospora musae]|uniref:Uncharacterized protein n=1 Tax=Pseudocercospora musae TaxID=113226 RepID=A0A139GT27_9PEZI|nr:hypothetical protein AC579_4527 [Pseudocercospora musae]
MVSSISLHGMPLRNQVSGAGKPGCCRDEAQNFLITAGKVGGIALTGVAGMVFEFQQLNMALEYYDDGETTLFYHHENFFPLIFTLYIGWNGVACGRGRYIMSYEKWLRKGMMTK